MLAGHPGVGGRTATIYDPAAPLAADGLPIVRLGAASALEGAALPSPGASLYVLDHEVTAAVEAASGHEAVTRGLSRLRPHVTPALLAAPADPLGPFDDRGADVLLARCPPDEQAAARASLTAGVRAAGRPVLLDVHSPEITANALVAAFDLGVAGGLIHTGDTAADRRLISEALELERLRLDTAPLISAIVCNYNGAAYLDGCLASLTAQNHPRFEVIVCDDGSTDDSVAIARRHPVRLLGLPHGGLARARNAGIEAARGEVVAFLDADAEAEPHWLAQIWRLLDRLGIEGTGGPNLPFPDAGWQERTVSGAPGAAIPVVTPEGECTHLAGCNMAFRRDTATRLGGFNPMFTAAHDDVDFCARLLDSGARLALAPSACVRHHRRSSIAGYLRQQSGYGANSAQDIERHKEMLPPPPQRSLAARIDPRRRRYVFAGPQGRQLFTVTSQPLHIGLPSKALVGLLAAGASGLLPAAMVGRVRTWSALWGISLGALLTAASVRVPAFAPARGVRGIAQRVVTAALWFAQPPTHRYGEWRAQRSASGRS